MMDQNNTTLGSPGDASKRTVSHVEASVLALHNREEGP